MIEGLLMVATNARTVDGINGPQSKYQEFVGFLHFSSRNLPSRTGKEKDSVTILHATNFTTLKFHPTLINDIIRYRSSDIRVVVVVKISLESLGERIAKCSQPPFSKGQPLVHDIIRYRLFDIVDIRVVVLVKISLVSFGERNSKCSLLTLM